MFEFFVFLAVIIGISQCQSITLPLTDTSSIINESEACACNFSIAACDEYCCCDTTCSSEDIKLWDLNRKCIENIYSSPYRIPECNRDYQKQASDLYLGLRIAYNIFKNLGCITTSNTLTTLQNTAINSHDYTAKIQDYVTKYSTLSTVTQLSVSNLMASTLITGQSYLQLYRTRSNSDQGCQSIRSVVYQTYPISLCQRQLTLTEMTAFKATEFKYSSYTGGTLLGLSVKVSSSYLITYDSVAAQKYQYTVLATPTDPTAAGFQNLVVGAIYQLTMPAVPVDDTNISGMPTSVEATLFFIDTILPNTNQQYIIPSISGIIYKTAKGEAYDISSKGGYSRGSPVRFKKSLDSTNEELLQPMFIGVESFDGQCIPSSVKDLSQGFEIKFLEEQKISCIKSSTVSFTTSNIYTAIANNLKYVARYGDSGSNNLSTEEWMLVTPCSQTDNIYQFSLKISYMVFGEKGKERFRINSADLTCSQISIDIVSYEFRFYVQFVEIPNTWSHFIGPSPQLIGGLPDDILAPFINYG